MRTLYFGISLVSKRSIGALKCPQISTLHKTGRSKIHLCLGPCSSTESPGRGLRLQVQGWWSLSLPRGHRSTERARWQCCPGSPPCSTCRKRGSPGWRECRWGRGRTPWGCCRQDRRRTCGTSGTAPLCPRRSLRSPGPSKRSLSQEDRSGRTWGSQRQLPQKNTESQSCCPDR